MSDRAIQSRTQNSLAGIFLSFPGKHRKMSHHIVSQNYSGLKLHKPGINRQITMPPVAIAEDVKWMYLYICKRFNIVSFTDLFAY